MLNRADHYEFDVVIVHTIDRFYRDLGGLLAALHRLQQHQVTFVSITENLDFTTPWGKLVLAVLGALAEIYIDKLREETKKGKQARARKGLWNGSIPFGYCNGLCANCTDVNGKGYCPYFGQPNRSSHQILMAHPIESVAVQLTYRWYETGKLSHRLIAKKLKAYELILPDGSTRHLRTKRGFSLGRPQLFTRSTVREILARIFYTGQVPYYGTNARGTKLNRRNISALGPGQHPVLISQDLFNRCQELAQGRIGNLPRNTPISR